MKAIFATLALAAALAGQLIAQEGPGFGPEPEQGPPPPMMERPEGGPPVMGSRTDGPWWNNPQVRERLNLNGAQTRKIKQITRDDQTREIDLRASVEKQDVALRTLLDSDTPDKEQVLAQVDKLSQARAQLERFHMEAMLAIRQLLTTEQARRLRELSVSAVPNGPGFEAPGETPPPPRGGLDQ